MSTATHQRLLNIRSSRGFLERLAAGIGLLGLLAVMSGCGPAPGYEVASPASYNVPPPEPRVAADELEAPGVTLNDGANNTSEAFAGGGGNAAEVDIGQSTDEYADNDPSALTDFRAALDGHGTWVDDATYGTVWVPAESEVGSDFTPYVSAGHWTYDDASNYVWVSDYSWGWAPFHYGRWTRLNHRGWVWIPGRTYAGAWVVWRTGGDYVGWAPAPPDWYWMNGYAYGWTWGYSPYYYSYCHRHYLYSPGFGGHVVYGYSPRGREIEARTVPYRQSAPAAPRGRVAAAPAVGGSGGRVAAAPAVGSGDRVAASPTVGGRVKADPRVQGPSPAELGIDRAKVPAPVAQDKGIERARAFSEPSSAQALGAQAPANTRRLSPRTSDRELVATSPRTFESRDPRPPTVRSPMVSSPGVLAPRSSSFDPVVRSPMVDGSSARPTNVPSRVAPTRIPDQGPLPSYRPSSPAIGSAPNASAFREGPLPSSPTVRSPSAPIRTPSDSFRGADAYRSSGPLASSPAPVVRAPSPSAPVMRSAPSAPVMRSAPSAPVMRSAPSAPVMRSAPSISSPSRSSSPSISRPSAPIRSGGGTFRRR